MLREKIIYKNVKQRKNNFIFPLKFSTIIHDAIYKKEVILMQITRIFKIAIYKLYNNDHQQYANFSKLVDTCFLPFTSSVSV